MFIKKIIFAIIVISFLALGYFMSNYSDRIENASTKNKFIIRVTGLVEKPLIITPKDLEQMPSRDVMAPLYCVADPNHPIRNGTWTGVPLKYILELAKIKDSAFKIAFFAADNYSTDLKVKEVLNDENIIIAYKFNGEPISPRLVVPGRWGYKWIKELVEIKLVDYDFKGTWESAGYPDDAYISPFKKGIT